MDARGVVALIEGRGEVWHIEPTDDVIVMGAQADGHRLTLWLAGPMSNESQPEEFEVRLIDELEDGLIAVWTACAVYELPRGTTQIEFSPFFLVRDDKRASLSLHAAPSL